MIQDLRVLLADIDGTLVQKGEAIMPKTRNAIIRLHEQGVLLAWRREERSRNRCFPAGSHGIFRLSLMS